MSVKYYTTRFIPLFGDPDRPIYGNEVITDSALVEEYFILTEAGEVLQTEAADNLLQEEAP